MSFVTGHDGNAGDVVLIYAKLFVHFKGGRGCGGEEEGGNRPQMYRVLNGLT